MSVDNAEARTRVLQLYKAWYRYVPQMVNDFDIPVSVEKTRDVLRQKFQANAHIKDTRVIDMLVIKVSFSNYCISGSNLEKHPARYDHLKYSLFHFKGQQDLQEVVEAWAQAPHIMSKHFKEAIKERPKDFMSKFLSGHD